MLTVFHMYRVIVLPVANTWMLWSLFNKLEFFPGPTLIGILGAILLFFLIVGTKVRLSPSPFHRGPNLRFLVSLG